MLSLPGLWEAFRITPPVSKIETQTFNSLNSLIFILDVPQRESASTDSCLLGGILGHISQAGSRSDRLWFDSQVQYLIECAGNFLFEFLLPVG